MKNFVDIKNNSFHFNSCAVCNARCCDGREGTVFSQLLIEDFKNVSKYFPILFTFGELGYLKAVVLFTNGKGFCPYIKENRCTIYENRPTPCKIYPLSPEVDENIYLDVSCPAVETSEPFSMIQKGKVMPSYHNVVFQNYQEKYLETHYRLEKINKKCNFEKVIEINNINFYKYKGPEVLDFMDYHHISLENNPIATIL